MKWSCQSDKVQNENKKRFLWNGAFPSVCLLSYLLMKNWRQWRQGLFFFFWSTPTCNSVRGKAWALSNHKASSSHQETGGRLLLLCLCLCLLVAGSVTHLHCPKELQCITDFRLAGYQPVRSLLWEIELKRLVPEVHFQFILPWGNLV